MNVLAVALGGALGASLRYAISQWVIDRFAPDFPWHTFVVNVTGAFLLGVLMAMAVERELIGHWGRLFLGVGVLGGYTTFSTLAFETLELVRGGAAPAAAANALGSVVLGLLAAMLGLYVGRLL